jgi:hypothetical protein
MCWKVKKFRPGWNIWFRPSIIVGVVHGELGWAVTKQGDKRLMAVLTTMKYLKRRGLKNMVRFCLISIASPPNGMLCASLGAKSQ